MALPTGTVISVALSEILLESEVVFEALTSQPLTPTPCAGYTADRGGHHRPSRGDPAGERSGVRSDSHQGEAPQRVAGDVLFSRHPYHQVKILKKDLSV